MRDKWIIEKEKNGLVHAIPKTEDAIALSILPDGDSNLFMRNGIEKNLKTGVTTKKRWLVGELNGVRCYIQGSNVIMTTQDKYP